MFYHISLVLCLLFMGSQPLFAQPAIQAAQGPARTTKAFVPGELVVRAHPDTSLVEMKSLIQSWGGKVLAMNSTHGYYRVSIAEEMQKAAFSLQLDPSVLSARPNYILGELRGEFITLYDLELMIARMIPAGRDRFTELAAKEELLRKVFYDKLFFYAAKDENLEDDPEVKVQVDEAVERTLVRAYKKRVQAGAISQEELVKFYDENSEMFARPEQIKVRFIRVSSQEEAEEILRLVRDGSDFGTLAKERSTDRTAKEGGIYGWVNRGQLPASIDDQAFSIKSGEVTDIVNTGLGFLIVQVEDKRPPQIPPFSEVEGQVREHLEKTRLAKALKNKKKELVEKYKGRVYPKIVSEVTVTVTQEELGTSLPGLQEALSSAIETPYD
jgi:peptidyl-prolyl cis-trans isomerase C